MAFFSGRQRGRFSIAPVTVALNKKQEAAVLIQSVWRGRQQRSAAHRLRIRRKPLGYYTHTLSLTYISHKSDAAIMNIDTRNKLHHLFEHPNSSLAAQVLCVSIISTIGVSIIGFISETDQWLQHEVPSLLIWAEVYCTVVFTSEYCIRLVVCDQGNLTVSQFFWAPMNMLDLLAFLPFYFELIMKQVGFKDSPFLRAFRAVRLIRVVRVLKLGRYASGMKLTARALAASSQAISVLLFLLFMGVLLFSSALFYFEKLGCPTQSEMTQAELTSYNDECVEYINRGVSPTFGLCCTEEGHPVDFPSIPAATWWAMVTMTSVGYGEVYPKTIQGKCIGFVVMLVGMVVIALPVAIVGQRFKEVYDDHNVEMAKAAAGIRMETPGQTWTLVPGNDALERFKHLRFEDEKLAAAALAISANLEEVWETREQLMRERRYEMEKQIRSSQKFSKLLKRME